MSDQDVAVEQDNAEFDAGFAEYAKTSEGERGITTPRAVGGADSADADQGSQGLPGYAADKSAANGDSGETDLAKKLAEIQAENDRLKQSDRSQRGRVAALTKKLEEQRAAIVPPMKDTSEGDAGTTDTEWNEFKNEFPEMASIVDGRLKKVAQDVSHVSNQIQRVADTQKTMVEVEIQAYRETQFEELRRKHSDFEQIINSQDFARFKAEAPAEIQAKIKSTHAEDAITVLDHFKKSSGWQGPSPTPGKSEVEIINEKRAANLRQSTGISSKPVGRSARSDTGSNDDFDAGFAEYVSKSEKRMALRR